MQLQLWLGAAGSAVIAIVSGLGEYRRRKRKRKRIDDVGFVPWQFIQVMAMLGTVILASVALNSR